MSQIPTPPKWLVWFGQALAWSMTIAQLAFGLVFTSIPIYLFFDQWLPAYQRLQNTDGLHAADSEVGLYFLGAMGLIFFIAGVSIVMPASKAALKLLTTNPSSYLKEKFFEQQKARQQKSSEQANTLTNLSSQTFYQKPKEQQPKILAQRKLSDGGLEFSSRREYLGMSAIVFVFAAFWNGVIALGIRDFIGDSFGTSILHWFFVAFMLPFVLVGLGMLAVFAYALLMSVYANLKIKLAKPEYDLTENPLVEWQFGGGYFPFTHLEVKLSVREFTQSSETNSKISSHEVFSQQIFVSHSLRVKKNGSFILTLPRSLPVSVASSSRLEWKVFIRAKAKQFPDLQLNFPITIRIP